MITIHDVTDITWDNNQWVITVVGDENMYISGECHIISVVGNGVVIDTIEFEGSK